MPAPVDFEQALPRAEAVAGPIAAEPPAKHHHEHAGEGAVSFRTGAIVAPERFDLVGLAGEMRPIELRARDDDGAWTKWVETANGDPVYFGGADEVQLRTRGWRPSGRLHYVNVSGTTSELGGLVAGARRAINSAFISTSAVLQPEAQALPARPAFVTRRNWGAKAEGAGCVPRTRPSYGRVKAAVVHHTVTSGKYSEAEAPAIVLGICRYHRNGNGWNDIGYDALVDRFGNLYAGRAGGLAKAVVGAHAQGFNSLTTGVAAIGTHTTTPISLETREALIQFLAWKLAVTGLNATGKTTLTSAGGEASRYSSGRRVRLNRVFGHGTVGLTACPGDALDLEIPKLRRLVQARIDADGGAVTTPTDPPPPPPPEEPPAGGTAPK
jgi:uncharacterized protein with LGFP repeats